MIDRRQFLESLAALGAAIGLGGSAVADVLPEPVTEAPAVGAPPVAIGSPPYGYLDVLGHRYLIVGIDIQRDAPIPYGQGGQVLGHIPRPGGTVNVTVLGNVKGLDRAIIQDDGLQFTAGLKGETLYGEGVLDEVSVDHSLEMPQETRLTIRLLGPMTRSVA